VRSFPTAVRVQFLDRIRVHPLRREITTTALVNGLVNRAGLTFAFRLEEETGSSAPDIVRAHEAARAIFDQEAVWYAIESLDETVGVEVQTEMYLASRRLVERGARWLLRYRPQPLPVAATVQFFAIPVARLSAMAAVSPRIEATAEGYAAQGVPHELAYQVASYDQLARSLDIAELAYAHTVEVEDVAAHYDETGERLRLDWLIERVVELPRASRWDALARNALREDAVAHQRRIVDAVMTAGSYEQWAAQHEQALGRVQKLLDDIRTTAVYDLTTLSVVLRELRALA
jgi:glutamate dehydrogenase